MLNFIVNYWIQVLFGLLISFFSYYIKLLKNYKKTLDATNEGVVVILKCKIIEAYNKFQEKSSITIYEKENILDLYKVYQKLECCDVINDLIKKIDSIPIK